MNVEGSDCVLIEVPNLNFPGRTKENHEKPQSG
jgi:hypothetical protein